MTGQCGGAIEELRKIGEGLRALETKLNVKFPLSSETKTDLLGEMQEQLNGIYNAELAARDQLKEALA